MIILIYSNFFKVGYHIPVIALEKVVFDSLVRVDEKREVQLLCQKTVALYGGVDFVDEGIREDLTAISGKDGSFTGGVLVVPERIGRIFDVLNSLLLEPAFEGISCANLDVHPVLHIG